MADDGEQEEEIFSTDSRSQLRCRMYENRYPDIDELVTVQVKRIEEMGAYVSLLEYDNIEGMILLSELSRRRIRSINKLIRVGRQEIVMCLRVDPDKGYIDLSKRRVSPEDVTAHEEKFNKSKAVHSIMRHVAETCNKDLTELYEKFGWPLYKKYGHAVDAFKIAVSDPDKIFAEFSLEAEVLEALMKQIRRRLTPQPVKVRCDFELTCFNYEGVDAIKKALIGSLSAATEEVPLKVKLVAPPLYVMSAMVVDKDKGVEVLTAAMAQVEESITASKGELAIKMKPRAVGAQEDKALEQLMHQMEMANQEVSGDDEEDEDEDD